MEMLGEETEIRNLQKFLCTLQVGTLFRKIQKFEKILLPLRIYRNANWDF